MQAYRITTDDATSYAATLTQAKDAIKSVPAPFRAAIVVDLIEVQSDKEGIVHALNGLPVIKPLYRSWRGTARGGLTETTDSLSGLSVAEPASAPSSSVTGD